MSHIGKLPIIIHAPVGAQRATTPMGLERDILKIRVATVRLASGGLDAKSPKAPLRGERRAGPAARVGGIKITAERVCGSQPRTPDGPQACATRRTVYCPSTFALHASRCGSSQDPQGNIGALRVIVNTDPRGLQRGHNACAERKVLQDKGPEGAKGANGGGSLRSILSQVLSSFDAPVQKGLTVHGVGYRAEALRDDASGPSRGGILRLFVGFGHPVDIKVPSTITVQCPNPTSIIVSGNHYQEVSQFVAKVRLIRPVRPGSPLPAAKKGLRSA